MYTYKNKKYLLFQIIVGERGVVNSRKLSCFCDPNCDCYEPISTRLASNDIHVSVNVYYSPACSNI